MNSEFAPATQAAAEAPLLSEQWFRVAELRPRLNAGVAAERVLYRGTPWMVMASPDGRRRVRLNLAAYALVGRCTGRNTLQQLWELLLQERQDDAPTQDEVVLQVMHLYREGFLAFDREPDFGVMAPLEPGTPRPSPAARNSLLAWRIPLGSPQRGLEPLLPLGRLLFSRGGAVAFAVLMALGVAAAWREAGLVSEFASRWLHTPHVMLLTWIAFPVLKLLHEGAHALAVRRFGGQVPEWGVTLMVFTPVPYVDASAADGFSEPRHRFAVSAAGAAVELALAALALLAASQLQPGVLRDLMLAIFVLGALTSLFINANPLLRFDGYHALTDALQLPNLGTRSARHWLRLLRRSLGLPAGEALQPAPGELAWWWGYAPASLVCRVVLSVGIVAWIGAQHFGLGWLVALMLGWSMLALPLLRAVRFLWGLQLDAEQARRGRTRGALAAAAALALLLAVPLPDVTLARGVIWLPDDSMVRAHTPGFVEEVLAHDGQQVEPGDPIARLSNLSLETEALDVEGRIAGLWVELNQAYGEDSAKALRVSQQIEAAQAARTRIDQRLQHLVLRAPAAGVLNLPRAQDLPGRFLAQGTVVGTLVRQGLAPGGAPAPAAAPATWHVRVALEAEQATDIEARASGIAVHLPTPGAASIPATLARDARAATRELPSAALGDRFGGAIVTDPADPQGRTAARDVVLLALELAAPADAGRPPLGQRVWVRFERGLRPLGWTLARRAQQSVLVHFAPLR
jgi:putative peptide zinc metalloprotease protein